MNLLRSSFRLQVYGPKDAELTRLDHAASVKAAPAPVLVRRGGKLAPASLKVRPCR